MLSSNGGISYQGFDIDSISDITGISINKMDTVERDSQHSGSFGSDNTDALLNASLRDFEGDESLLESISQVDGDIGQHKSSKDRTEIHVGKQISFAENSKADIKPEGFSVHVGTSEVSYGRNGISEVQNFHGIHDSTSSQQSFEESKNLKDYDQGFGSMTKSLGNLRNKAIHMQRKFSSDSDITLSGRDSVIKHSSLPSVNHESVAKRNSLDKKETRYVNGERKHQENETLLWGDPTQNPRDINDHLGASMGDPYNHEHQGMTSHRNRDIRDFHGYGDTIRDITGESRHEYDGHLGSSSQKFGGQNAADISRTNRSVHNRDGYYESQDEMQRSKECLQNNFVEQSQSAQMEEMLLGVWQDPETNELYDDKVREGADLLSRVLGGDHNVSSTSHSSRSSERNEKSKHSSIRERGSLNKQKSLDSSIHSEPRLPRSSSPTSSISKGCEKSGKLRSSLSRDRTPLRHHGSLDSSLNTEGISYKNSSPKRYEQQTLRDDSRSYVSAKEPNDARSSTQYMQTNGTLTRDLGKYISHAQEEPILPTGSLVHGKKEYNFLENGHRVPESEYARNQGHLETYAVPDKDETLKRLEVKTFDEKPRSQTIDHKQLELDIEEILSRKKIALQELQMLEESLQRNKADMKSSESLVEQYRWQATQARSELMELEKKRNQLQEECISLDGDLKKAKEKETFNSDEVTFGRSKDEIFKALREREQFKQDLDSTQETLKREQRKAKLAQEDFRGKIRNLEAELGKQHEENVKNLQITKEERKSHIEILEEKLKREANQWKRATENAELRIKQLEEALIERNDELNKFRVYLREEKQKNLDIEKQWRSQLESERQDADIKYDEQERSWKDREEKHFQQQKELENLVEERTTDFRRSEERCRSQTEELQKIIENKNEEIKMVRGLVRQQEDATRVLGERLRNEAREHVRNAVAQERQSLLKEKERMKRGIEDEKEKHARIVKQMTEQLDIQKEGHLQTKETLNKLKQEGDDLRKRVVEVHGERISGVQRARQENGEELGKIKDKLHEFTVQADKLEKIDQETAKAIYEECRKIAEMVDMPLSFKTPTRFFEELSGGNNDDTMRVSPTKEALASLRQCNEELRQRLSDMKKQMGKQSTRSDNATNGTNLPSISENELTELSKRLVEKDEEIQRLRRAHSEEIQKLKEEKRKEQLSYRKTIAKLEQEFQKLVTAKTSSTACKTKRDQVSRSTFTRSNGGGAYSQSQTVSPAAPSVEKSSSADLLKHLQDRVKKLRAENENLKKTSDNESLVKNTRNVKGFNSESVRLQSKGLTISQLRTPTKSSGLMNENIEQVSRIQKLLAGSTKDDTTFRASNTD